MKRVFTAITVIDTSHVQALKALMEDSGIPVIVRNENLSIARGDIPNSECSPELWVINDEDFPAARQIMDDWRNAPVKIRAAWKCPKCGEQIEGQFTSCWNCGTEREGGIAAT